MQPPITISEIKNLGQTYFFRRPLLWVLGLMVLLLCLFKYTGRLNHPGSMNPSTFIGTRCNLVGLISEQPELNSKGLQIVLDLETVRIGTTTVSVQGKTLIQILGAGKTWAQPGDRISAWGLLMSPSTARIPGTFDYSEFLANKNIYTQIFTSEHACENFGYSNSYRLTRAGAVLKNHAIEVFQTYLAHDEAAVLSGLVVGARPRFDPEIKRIFTESGTMHVLVASGSNVAFVVGFWFVLMRIVFRLSRRWSLVTSIPAVWCYVLVTGADPPIIRAGVMTTAAILSYVLSREDRPYQHLGLAALTLLLTSPKTIFSIGFQMSFLTVFGLVYYLPKIKGGWMVRLISTSWTAQLWILPITLEVFKRFFPISLLSNCIIVPMAAAGLGAGLVLIAADFIYAHILTTALILEPIKFSIGFYLRAMIALTRFFSDQLGFGFWVTNPGKIWTVGYFICALSLPELFKKHLARWVFSLGLGMMILGWWNQHQFRNPPKQLHITWLDMGRTLTTIIETPEGEKILLDPGPRGPTDSIERSLMPYLTERGIGKIEALVYTGRISPPPPGVVPLEHWLKVQRVFLSTAPFQVGGLSFTPLSKSLSGSARVPLLVRYGPTQILLGKTIGLKVQDTLLEKNITRFQIVQARFSDRAQWREEFIRRVRPKVLIETGYDSERFPSCPPWDLQVVVPQKTGIYAIELEAAGGKN